MSPQAFSIPIKLKYECPPAFKFGKADPLWKSATTNFLKVVKDCASRIDLFGEGKFFITTKEKVMI